MNILVVDDDALASKALSRLLRACGHTVHLAYEAREGLRLASRIKPDLILHDIAMPVMDGYDAARRLRAMPYLSASFLIACSGSIEEDKARAAGFDGWLIKPISDRDLDTVLAMVLGRINQDAPSARRNPAEET